MHYQCCVGMHPTSFPVLAEMVRRDADKVVSGYFTEVVSRHARSADRSKEGPEHAIRLRPVDCRR
jgi:hypothetical protein